MLGGELNYPLGPYKIDVAVEADGIAIAVEYDSWYWHAGQEDHDAQRDREVIAAGWRVLRVKSRASLPSQEQLDAAIACLLAGEDQVEIVLDDWGEGPTRYPLAIR
jgi:very-short-patch-repair endonuclease